MARTRSRSAPKLSDEAIAERLQSILINAAEGRRSIGDDGQYTELRKRLLRAAPNAPSILITHPSVDSFSAFVRGIENRQERAGRVRTEFEPLFRELESRSESEVDASTWTGVEGRIQRVRLVKKLLPLAQAAVEGLITSLAQPGPNGGPLLEEHDEALGHFRQLHHALGLLLAAADSGHLEDDLGEGLAAEAARYAKRAARALSRDPMPYVSSALLLGLLTACGLPGLGGYLGGIALNIRRNARTDND